jgi:hypothetical protein
MAAPSYYVETPDGQKVPFDVPTGASEAQIRTLAARALKQKLPDAKYQRPVLSKEASQSLLPASARGELKADDTALSKVTGTVRGALGALGVGERYGAHLANRVTGALNDLTPVGDAVTASDARDDWRAGDYLGAIGNTALAGIGLIPGAGDLAAKGGRGLETLYRGVSRVSPKHGNYYTGDRDWARQFTQSGLDSEVISRQIDAQHIYEAEALPMATRPEEIDAAIAEAKRRGLKAIRVNEGTGEPLSVFVFDRSALMVPK